MKHKVLEAIQKYSLVSKNDTIVVALSGGADSSALLHFFKSIEGEFNLKLYACHLDHCLRGEEAERDRLYCQELCRKLNIPIYVYVVDINKLSQERGQSIELCAREERYRIFLEMKNRLENNGKSSVKIATAHTLTDNVETVIWNMCRGASSNGLTGIPIVRDYIIRPFLYVKREEIESYCQSNSINFVTDSTNLSNDYTRNIIRNRVVPVLREINPAFENNISSLTQRLKLDEDFFEQETNSLLKSAKRDNGFCIKEFFLWNRAICYRAIARLLEDNKIEKSSHTIENIYLSLEKRKKLQLSNDVFLFYNNDKSIFYIDALDKESLLEKYFDVPVKIGNNQVIEGKAIELSIINMEEFNKIKIVNKNVINYCLDYDKITLSVKIRQKKDGDKISIFNRNGTKAIKKLFNEAGLSLLERSRRFLLCDSNDKVLWAEGFGCSVDVSIDKQTANILYLKVMEG